MSGLSAAVGVSAPNRAADVVHVQRLLADSDHSPGRVDGICGRRTIGAILSFQREFLRNPDGRVDVAGPTYRRLRAGHRHAAPTPQPARPRTRTAVRAPEAGRPVTPRPTPPRPRATPPASGVDWNERLPIPARATINRGLDSPGNALMIRLLGQPRDSYDQVCRDPTNPRLARMILRRDLGPFTVRGLRPAVESLTAIMAEVARDHPDLHARLGTAGMLCCRYVRNSTTSISNHSFGTAIDMNINGRLVPRGARYVEVGLQVMAPYFNRHGWFWGAGYAGTKDPHHFEVSTSLLQSWDL